MSASGEAAVAVAPTGRARAWAAAVLAVAVGAHALALGVPFIKFDDGLYVTHAWKLAAPGLEGLAAIWSTADIGPNRSVEFFPLRDTVYWVLYKLFGPTPAPFHAVNLAFHAAASLLVLALGSKLRLTPFVAGLGALLFAAHPIHVESVAWVAGLKDPMFATFALASLWAFAAWRETRRPAAYAAALLALVAALLTKSAALGVPLVMAALDRGFPQAPEWKQTARRVAGPALISALFLVHFVAVGRAAEVLVPHHGDSWAAHFFFSAWAFVRYVQQALAPFGFRLYYCFTPFEGWRDARWLGVAAVGVAAAALALLLRARARARLAFLAVWFVALLLPVLNLIPFPTLMNDRYLYLPVAAACWALALALEKVPGRLGPTLAAAVVTAFAAQSLVRTFDWKDQIVLFREVTYDPRCAVDNSPPAATLMLTYAAMTPDADESFRVLGQVADHPGFLRNDREVQCTELTQMAIPALRAQRLDEARLYATRITLGCPESPAGWQLLSEAVLLSDPAAARQAAERAYRLWPRVSTLFVRGLARVATGEAGAGAEVEEAVRANPAELCPRLRAWGAKVGPQQRAPVGAAAAFCRQAR